MKRSVNIYLSKGVFDGRSTWNYVIVDALKVPLFKKAVASGSVDVSDFGKVIASGWGENPPDHIAKAIEAIYC